MKTISTKEFILISIDPIIKKLKQWSLDKQIKSLDRHIDVVNKSIKNEQGALRELQYDRMLLNNRRNSLR